MKYAEEPIPVILGAGLAGLSCAYRLAQKGIKVVVLEKESYVGGLAASREALGLCYDYGPHRFHTQNKNIIDFLKDLMGDNLIIQKRKSMICMKDGSFIYPLDLANIWENMPKRVLAKCFYDYVLAKIGSFFAPRTDGSFESWVMRRFGATLYRIFFGSYTQKVLGVPPSDISKDWAEARITLLSLWSVVEKTIFASPNPPRTYANQFYYPKQGGIGQIAEVLKQGILSHGSHIVLEVKIKSIRYVQNGSRSIAQAVTYEHNGKTREQIASQLMSTIPITSLPSLLDSPCLLENKQVFDRIKFRALIFAYFVLKTESFTDNQWIYLPEDRFFSNRISEPKNFSKYGWPEDRTIVCAEISCDYEDEKWRMDPEMIKQRVLEDIRQLGILKAGEENVLDYFCHKLDHCYPVYRMNYKNHINEARKLFDSFENLECFGRNALFQYGNMDDAIEMGLRAADGFLAKTEKNKAL